MPFHLGSSFGAFRLRFGAALCLGLGSVIGVAQDADALRGLENFRRYLAGSPYHERVFEQLLSRLAANDAFDELVAACEADHAAHPDNEATAIVLARLHLEARDFDRALELLGTITDPRAAELRARVHLALEDRASAIAELDLVIDSSDDPELVRSALERRASTQLASGDRDGARASLVELGALDPDDAAWRIEVGERLAAAGFPDAAAEELRAAADAAGGDTLRRSTALAALGRELVELEREEDAVDAWFEALPSLAHDHWLARDLRARLVALHEQGGRLGELVDRYEAMVDAHPADVAARIAWIDSLERAGRDDEALAAAEDAVARFAENRGVARARRELARRLDRDDVWVEEAQRWIARDETDPLARELRFELGSRFAAEERFEVAAEQWRALLESAPEDAAIARRVAREWALRGRDEDATPLFERAIEIEPKEVERYADLVQHLWSINESKLAVDWIERAERAIAGSAQGLTRVAELFSAARRTGDVVRCLTAAVELDPRSLDRRLALADAQLANGDRIAAQASLRTALGLGLASPAPNPTLLRLALERYARSFAGPGAIAAAIESETRRLERGDPGADPRVTRLAMLALWIEEGDPTRVERAFKVASASHPEALWILEWRADWLVEIEEPRAAIEALDQLLERGSRRALAHLYQQVELLLELEDFDGALLRLERAVDVARDDADALDRIAQRYVELDRHSRAAELWERSLALRPATDAVHLALAQAYSEIGAEDDARRTARLAYSSEDRDMRAEALELLAPLLQGEALDREIARLDERVAMSSFALDSALLAIDLLRKEERSEEALERVEGLLRTRPFESQLLARRAQLLLDVGRLDEALAEFRKLRERGSSANKLGELEVIEALLDADQIDAAIDAALALPDPLAIRPLLDERELDSATLRLLERLAQDESAPVDILRELGRRYGQENRLAEGIDILERVRERGVGDWRDLLELGSLYASDGDRDRAIQLGREAIPDADDVRFVGDYFARLRAKRPFRSAMSDRLVDQCTDERLIRDFFLYLASGSPAPETLALAARLRNRALRDGCYPDGHTLVSWARWLHGVELARYSMPPKLVEGRIDQLAATAEQRGLREKEAADYAWLVSFSWLSKKSQAAVIDRSLLDRIFADYSRSPLVLTALGACFDQVGSVRSRVEVYGALQDVLREPKNVYAAEEELARTWRRYELEFRPVLQTSGASFEQIEDALELCFVPSRREPWELDVILDEDLVRVNYARALTDAQREREAVEILSATPDALTPGAWRQRVEILSGERAPVLLAEARRALRNLASIALADHADLGAAAPHVTERLMGELDIALWETARVGQPAMAYEVLLENGHAPKATEFLMRPGLHELITNQLFQRVRTAKKAVERDEFASALERELELRELSDAVRMLAGAYREGGKKDQRKEPELWDSLREVAPFDQAALWHRARVDMRAQEWESAARALESLVLVLREWSTRPEELREVWNGQRLGRGGFAFDDPQRSELWLRTFSIARKMGRLDPVAPTLASIYARLMSGHDRLAVDSLEELLEGAGTAEFPDPAALEALLEDEDFGTEQARARSALDVWRARHTSEAGR